MSEFKNAFIIIVINDPITHWCDYAFQTVLFLAKQNTVVVFCSENTITWKDILHKKRGELFEHAWNALLFHPFFIVPGQRFHSIKMLNYVINAFFLNAYLFFVSHKKKKILWFFDPFYVVSLLPLFSRYTSVYDCVDYYDGISKQLCAQNRQLLKQSTFVFANSYALKKKLRVYRSSVVTVPLGFAADLFQSKKIRRPTQNTSPVVGFVGGITRRIDYHLMTVVAKRLPEIKFVFYGAKRSDVFLMSGKLFPDIQAFFQLKNVVWKGAIAKEAIPDAISSFDICMIPYIENNLFNKYCFPMKVMEYFYLGKPVVSTPIEELKRFPRYIHIGKTAKEWEQHIRSLLSISWPVQFQKEQQKIAEGNSWKKKVMQMMDIIVKGSSTYR